MRYIRSIMKATKIKYVSVFNYGYTQESGYTWKGYIPYQPIIRQNALTIRLWGAGALWIGVL